MVAARVYGQKVLSRLRAVAALVAVLMVCGCVTHYPADPAGTLQRVTGGTLRVGASHNEPFVSVTGSTPSGREVELVNAYARTLNAKVAWTFGGEEELVDQLEHGRLDLVIGGLTEKTPWQSKVGLTKPYAETTDEFGQQDKHVMAVRMGENAFLLNLDEFLQSREGQQ